MNPSASVARMTREVIVQRILAERERQFDLPGREFDVRNTPNDWAAIVGRYLFEETRRGAFKPSRACYEDSLVKAAAVLLAALEHCSMMDEHSEFSCDFSLDSPDSIS
jgi:hypothetical protein